MDIASEHHELEEYGDEDYKIKQDVIFVTYFAEKRFQQQLDPFNNFQNTIQEIVDDIEVLITTREASSIPPRWVSILGKLHFVKLAPVF